MADIAALIRRNPVECALGAGIVLASIIAALGGVWELAGMVRPI
jgi:hypothetical protein